MTRVYELMVIFDREVDALEIRSESHGHRRPHTLTAVDDDLYFARRVAPHEPFATPTPAVELNSAAAEGDPWLSADGREIVFFSTRTGEKVLYRATR